MRGMNVLPLSSTESNASATTTSKSVVPPVTQGSRSRYGRLVTGLFLMLVLGLIYGWSIMKAPLAAEFLWNETALSFTLSISMCSFCISSFFGSRITYRFSPRVTLLCSAVLLFIGFSLVSFVQYDSIWLLYLAYGVCGGSGVGFGYNTTLATIVAWFPDRTGLISGIVLMGFGSGTLVLGTLASLLFASIGWRPTYILLGVCGAALIALGSFALRFPTALETASLPGPVGAAKKRPVTTQDFKPTQMMRTPTFWSMFLWCACLGAFWQAVMGNGVQCALSAGAVTTFAVFLVGLLSLFNGIGRIIMGFIVDLVGVRKTLTIASCLFLVAVACIVLGISQSQIALLALGLICTGTAGSALPSVSTVIIKEYYGMRFFASNSAILNFDLLIQSTVGPLLAATVIDTTGSYATMALICGVLVLLSFAFIFLVRPPKALVEDAPSFSEQGELPVKQSEEFPCAKEEHPLAGKR